MKCSPELLVTSFTNSTFEINRSYREKKQIACCYSAQTPISQNIAPHKDLYIIAGNIETNRIIEIGKVKNAPKYRKIYDQEKYNGYAYSGLHYINRDDIHSPEGELVFKLLEYLYFRGHTHLKRIRGIIRFPQRWLHNLKEKGNIDILAIISGLFEERFSIK
jgi:hypothetical protein